MLLAHTVASAISQRKHTLNTIFSCRIGVCRALHVNPLNNATNLMQLPFSNFLRFAVLLLFSSAAPAQAQQSPTQAFAGYFAPFGIHPGFTIGADIPIKTLSSPEAIHSQVARQLVAVPQLAYFTHHNDYNALLVNGGLGLKAYHAGGKSWHMLSVHTGYIAHSKVTSVSVDLQGKITNRERSMYGVVMPAINFSYGRGLNHALGWYSKIGCGYQMSGSAPNVVTGLLELGVRFRLTNTSSNEQPQNSN